MVVRIAINVLDQSEGEWCTGFDSAILANGLGVDLEGLFSANRNGSLFLAGIEDVVPQRGGIAAKMYSFMLGNKLSMLTIEHFQTEGNA